jgi:hypothetical protein
MPSGSFTMVAFHEPANRSTPGARLVACALPHIAPEIPEIVKHPRRFNRVRQMGEGIEKHPDRNVPPGECHHRMGGRAQHRRGFEV